VGRQHKHVHTTPTESSKAGHEHTGTLSHKNGDLLFKKDHAMAHKENWLYKSPKLERIHATAHRWAKEAHGEARLHRALLELRALEHNLRRANHDYGGHRPAALTALLAAEQQLRLAVSATHKHQPSTTGPKGTTGAPANFQALSNQEMLQTMQILQDALAILRAAEHDYGGNRAGALRDLDQAIHHLRQALNHHHHKGSASVG
jgi:hypothetical protein